MTFCDAKRSNAVVPTAWLVYETGLGYKCSWPKNFPKVKFEAAVKSGVAPSPTDKTWSKYSVKVIFKNGECAVSVAFIWKVFVCVSCIIY